MKLRVLLFSAAALCFCVAVSSSALTSPPPFDLSWHTIDSGGGTSSGGGFMLEGTIGQPEAGLSMAGGAYVMTGGFWVSDGPIGQACAADLDNNGDIGFGDLLIVLDAWGNGAGDDADLDNDGTVGFGDLLIVLDGWGLCP
jgi:hypothetical protein